MRAGMQVLLLENLKALRLSSMVKHLEEHLRQARESGIDFDDFLLNLTEIELQVRGDNRLKRRLSEAKFPQMKTLEGLDYEAASGLDRRLIGELAGGEYIRQRRNVIFAGKTGTGKTHMSIGLGVEACKQTNLSVAVSNNQTEQPNTSNNWQVSASTSASIWARSRVETNVCPMRLRNSNSRLRCCKVCSACLRLIRPAIVLAATCRKARSYLFCT